MKNQDDFNNLLKKLENWIFEFKKNSKKLKTININNLITNFEEKFIGQEKNFYINKNLKEDFVNFTLFILKALKEIKKKKDNNLI